MKTKALALKLIVMMLGSCVFSNAQESTPTQPEVARAQQAAVRYGQLPLTFEANQGQTAGQVKFLSRGKGYTAFLTGNGMILSLRPSQGSARQPNANNPATAAAQAPTVLQFTLVGAAANPTVVGEDLQPGKVNYFIGNDPTKWQTNIATYGKIRYHNVYPGIDMVYYGNHRQLEYDFAVAPGADPNQIQFAIAGANSISLDSSGNLVLDTGNGDLHFERPMIYQESNGVRVPVPGAYVMKDATHIGFSVSAIDPTKPTVIDPVLVYASYLGGAGDDVATGVAVDSTGSVYLAGYTDSTDFPIATLGSLPPGNTHVFVSKFDPSGSNLVYSDYLGGNNYEYGFALTINSADEVYVTGSTASSNFPVVNAYDSTYPGSFNIFLTEISADGSTLLYSTYFGGNGSDLPSSIVLDSSSDVLIAGNTTSTNFPVSNAYQSTVSANQGGVFGNYGFLSKFTPDGSALVYSTYFAGNTNVSYNCGGTPCWSSPYSGINGLAVDAGGNAYVGGTTNTYNFPTTSNTYQTSNSAPENGTVAFVSKFSSSGTLTYSTYFYESSGAMTAVNGIAVDSSGSAYVTGTAFSDGTFPLTTTAICDPSVYGENCEFSFVTKFNSTASSLLYSTFLGPYNLSTPVAIALDANDDAYILGSTNSTTFQLVNGIEGFSTEGTQYVVGSDYDILLVEIDPAAASQLFATYLGGSGNNTAGAMVLDASANIYVTGSTDSIDFPVSQGSFQEIIGGNTDAFIAKVSPAVAPAVSLMPLTLEYASQTIGTSVSQTVLLRNMGSTTLTISSITTSTGFTQTNDCGSSVPAAGTCTLSVTFSPSAVGSDAGTVSIADDAAGSPHVINLSGIGTGALVVLAPTGLTFTPLPVGTTSAQQTVSLTNSGNVSLTISSIQVSGDFTQTNNCGSSLAASATCQIQIAFAPAAAGALSGALTINDDAANSPQALALSGTGQAAVGITLSSTALTFAGQVLDSASSSQSITVTNHTASAVTISSVSVTGDFTQTNNCSAVAANGGSCSITVAFAPSVSGSRTGTLTINTSAGSPETVSLTGTGLDFSLGTSASSATIQVGSTATYKLTVTPLGGSFSSAIQLSCSGLPAQTSCAFSPSSVTPGASAASVTMTITTTSSSSDALRHRGSNNYVAFALWGQLQGFGLLGIVFTRSKRRLSKKPVMLVLMVLAIAGLIFMSACAGGTGIAPQSPSGNQTGTQTGTYTVSAIGTSGSLKHSVPLTLNVQQN
jgi:hypothetical protein